MMVGSLLTTNHIPTPPNSPWSSWSSLDAVNASLILHIHSHRHPHPMQILSMREKRLLSSRFFPPLPRIVGRKKKSSARPQLSGPRSAIALESLLGWMGEWFFWVTHWALVWYKVAVVEWRVLRPELFLDFSTDSCATVIVMIVSAYRWRRY